MQAVCQIADLEEDAVFDGATDVGLMDHDLGDDAVDEVGVSHVDTLFDNLPAVGGVLDDGVEGDDDVVDDRLRGGLSGGGGGAGSESRESSHEGEGGGKDNETDDEDDVRHG